MAELKTKRTKESVSEFIAAVESDARRADAKVVAKLMQEVVGEKPYMLGPTIVGFGSYEGKTGAWPIVGFSPRKANLVLYLSTEFPERAPLLKKLGKHKAGKSCVYLNKLADVDMGVLRKLVERSVAYTRAKGGDEC
ncbi:MAG: DUF1801 domain-containing protein [Hyphomonadaceae bacterium]|nr:DUF1801 domain-containing protein [Hyphomonadaceae bacterium]